MRRHLVVLQGACRVSEAEIGRRHQPPKRWQRCFATFTGVFEDVARPPRRHRPPRHIALTGEWAPPETQLEFWPAPRPPLQRPRSLFARKPLSRLEMAFGKSIVDEPSGRKPSSRQDCLGKDEPCPHARCRYNLAIDVNEIGSVKINFPGWSVLDMEETCALNVARQPQTVERTARLMNLSTERIRQIEREAWRKIARRIDRDRLLRGPRKVRDTPQK